MATNPSTQHSTPEHLDRNPTYHQTSVPYLLPNDAPEHLRLEAQHGAILSTMSNRLLHAPLTSPTRLLDVGCGTGIMTINLASLFPSAQTYGIDLSPVPPIHAQLRNVHYLQGNLFDLAGRAPLEPGTFDFIFSRMLICGMDNWDRYVETAAALLRPGGWLEAQELDWIWYDGDGAVISDGWEWLRIVREKSGSGKLDYTCGSRMADRMRGVGLTDVTVMKYVWPFGRGWEAHPEGERLAEYCLRAMPVAMHHMLRRILEGSESEERIAVLDEEMRRDVAAERGKHWVYYVTVGRRGQ